ncbi:hypothetical protein PIB30_000381 [Stylosanthes scabra]|uniref:Uncharacterized protein n=1 Tax=Stylosanthes scabra TaxID=79078 RepID=A0ABU6U1Y8_9FABA|nr:hypothetical protein [Stylosanthes scabra]
MTLKRKRATKLSTCDVDDDDANIGKRVRSHNKLPSSPTIVEGPMCSSSHWWCYALNRSRKELYVLASMLRKKDERERKVNKINGIEDECLISVLESNQVGTVDKLPIRSAYVRRQENG